MVEIVWSIRLDFLPGPGTSLRLPGTSQGGGPTPAVRYFLPDLYNDLKFYHWWHFPDLSFLFWNQGLWHNQVVLSLDLWDPARSQGVLGRWNRPSRPHALQVLLVLSLVLLADSSAWEQWVNMPEIKSVFSDWEATCETLLYFFHQSSYIWNTESAHFLKINLKVWFKR